MRCTLSKAVATMSLEPRLLEYDEALQIVLAEAKPLGTEVLDLTHILSRTLAESCLSTCDLPIFDNSAVDGYAVATSLGPSSRYQLVGEVPAGAHLGRTLTSGQAARVLTGAPVPNGTFAVVMQEEAVIEDNELVLRRSPAEGQHIRRRAEELTAGDVVFEKGHVCTPASIGAMAAAGIRNASVFRLPKVAVLVTGNELAVPGSKLQPGQIFESNSVAMTAAVRALGCDCTADLVSDDQDATRRAFEAALAQADIVISSGGVSVGTHDLVRPVLEELGVEQRFWGVAIKPGKPFFFGTRERTAVFGLPGNPVSALTIFQLFVRPFIQRIAGRASAQAPRTARLSQPLEKKAGRAEFVPARLNGANLEPFTGRASHKASLLASADALALLPTNAEELPAGTEVSVHILDWGAWE
jgi:molybdopterin molybdotransferase